MDEQLSQSSECTLNQLLSSDSYCDVYNGLDQASGGMKRVIAFTLSAFGNAQFREAYKSDRSRLQHLRHPAIATWLGDGEFADRLYYLQETHDWPTIKDSSLRGTLKTDDIIEIGWQLCSALQQAHNAGLFHGGVSEESILLSDDLRVLLCDFRLEYWRSTMGAAEDGPSGEVDSGTTPPASIALSAASDLLSLVRVLHRLATESAAGMTAEQPEFDPDRLAALDQLLHSLSKVDVKQWPYTARDVQGLLGEILIGDGQEAMAVVDHRIAASQFRTSIVEELFDDTSPAGGGSGEASEQSSGLNPLILPIAVGALLAVLLLWAAGLLG